MTVWICADCGDERGKEWTSAGVSDVLRRQATGKHRGKAMTP